MSGEGRERRRRAAATHGAHGGGHHGGAWKVAYADFTTAMMALFLILWILSSASKEQKQSIANYFRSDGPFRDGGASLGGGALDGGTGVLSQVSNDVVPVDLRRLEKTGQELREKLAGDAGLGGLSSQVQVSMGDEGLIIEISEDADDALFAVGSATMDEGFARILDHVAESLAPLRNQIRIEGHTDGRKYPSGAVYTNWELSVDRANAARRRLEGTGVTRRFESVVGYGDAYPKYSEDPNAPGNRRITLTVLRDDSGNAPAEPAATAGASEPTL